MKSDKVYNLCTKKNTKKIYNNKCTKLIKQQGHYIYEF